ncbi:MAG: CUB domain-containing protein [Gelidibacter sp.]
MKLNKLLQLLVVCCFVIACTKDTFEEPKTDETSTRIADDQYDNSYLGVYKGLFSTNDGLTRGSVVVTLSPSNDAIAQIILSTGEQIELKSNKVKLTVDNTISNLRFSSAGLSTIDATLDFSVEGDGLNPLISNVNFDNKESDVLIAKNLSRAPLTPITGTYVRTAGTGGFPTSGRTWNVMSIGAGEDQNFAVQVWYGGRLYNVPAANSTQSGCTTSGYTTCAINGSATILGYPVSWTGTHKYNPGNAGNDNQCAEVMGTWSSTYGNSSGTFVSDTNCSGPAVANDTCANAITIGAGTYAGSIVNASNSDTPTICNNNLTAPFGGPGVWYSYSTPTNKTVVVDTEGTQTLANGGFDTQLRVLGGTCGALTCIDNDDDDGTGLLSTITFNATGGVTYYIFLGGYNNQVGAYTLNLAEFTPPANDLCANAIPVSLDIPTTGYTTLGTNTGAPQTNCNSVNLRQGPGVWHTYTNATASNKIIKASTAGSNFTTRLGILSGSCAALNCVTASTASADLTFTAAPNTTYFIYITAANGVFGNYTLTLTELFPPANDTCTNAIAISCGGTASGSTTTATTTGAPGTCVETLNTAGGVWYSFASGPSISDVSVDTFGSTFDTKLGVFRGTCAGLTCVTGNDDVATGVPQSAVTFRSIANTTYYFYVTGYQTNTGNFTLNVSSCIPDVPGNTAPVCGGYYVDNGGSFGNYGNNRNDIYTINAGTGNKVRLNFRSFSTAANDYLRMYDGTTTAAPLITVSGTGTPISGTNGFTGTGNNSLAPYADGTLDYVESSGQYLTVRFTSNATGTSAGFVADVVCFAGRNSSIDRPQISKLNESELTETQKAQMAITKSKKAENRESEVGSSKIFRDDVERMEYNRKHGIKE